MKTQKNKIIINKEINKYHRELNNIKIIHQINNKFQK